MNILKALLKQLLGVRYERVTKSFVSCLILFFAIHAAEIKMKIKIAPSILFLTATAFSAGIMWQNLRSAQNADSMMGLFMLPFSNRKLTFSLVLALTSYTLITKTIYVLVLFFAVSGWSALRMAVSLLCACNGCFTAAAWYTMINEVSHHKKKKMIPFVALWCWGVLLSIFVVKQTVIISFVVFISLFLSISRLLRTDAYVFYHPVLAKSLIKRTKGTGSVVLYLLRYLVTNKNYLINTAGLCVIAVILPLLLGQFEGLNVVPLGFASLCLNTPICTLLSCDPNLEQAVRVLPGQVRCFCTRYCFFIFSINMAVNSVYLMSWQIQCGGICGIEIITALLIALQSAILSVLLEWFYPIRNWKIENDLWHHPRKYIVPLIMMLIAGFMGMWPVSIWMLLCIMIGECFSLFLISKKSRTR